MKHTTYRQKILFEPRRLKSLFVGLAAVSLVSCAATLSEAEVKIVPHQAIYKLSLAADSPTQRFNGVDGAAVSIVERTCEGWEVNEQVVMTMLTSVGGAIQREMNYKARESLDGQDFVFESRSVTNGRAQKFSGSARYKSGGTVEAEFITPRPFEMPLPNDTRFYVGMTTWLLDLIAAGQRTGQTFAFDGTDDEGPQKVTAFVLGQGEGTDGTNGDPTLLAGKSWRVRLAFFPVTGQASEPDFEIALGILENGVITNFKLIFDDLTVDQTLEDLLPVSEPQCG